MDRFDKIIPKHKGDIDFFENLKLMNIDDIRESIPLLLVWMQDGNWPVAEFIMKYFSPYVNKIEKEIISILKGNDEMWKYWVLLGLIYHSDERPSDIILSEVKYLSENPTLSDREVEVDEIAQEIIEKYEYFE